MKPTEMTTTRGRDQFYPTPRALADKMLETLDMNYVNTVLEPSAGKGDLVAAIARKSRAAYRHRDLDMVYRLLSQLGYLQSTEEQELRKGTHKLFWTPGGSDE